MCIINMLHLFKKFNLIITNIDNFRKFLCNKRFFFIIQRYNGSSKPLYFLLVKIYIFVEILIYLNIILCLYYKSLIN